MIPKIIHMTYKHRVHPKYINAWKKLNPEYKIMFSLDNACIKFLNENFQPSFGNLFIKIPQGMYKADLWRLCKLYIEGGVYADVDLVPHTPINKLIEDGHTFYTAIAAMNTSCFQAIIITVPKNPIILECIFSFIKNKAWTRGNGPCHDMYNVLKKVLKVTVPFKPGMPYKALSVPIEIDIGVSTVNNKVIKLYNNFPENTKVVVSRHAFKDSFKFTFKNKTMIVTRSDQNCGWGHHHHVTLLIPSNQSVYFFKEKSSRTGFYVAYKNIRVFDSRYKSYATAKENGGRWK